MNVLMLEDLAARSDGQALAFVYNRGFGHSTAGCSCGWTGRRRHLKAAAEQDAWSHSVQQGCGISSPLVFPHSG